MSARVPTAARSAFHAPTFTTPARPGALPGIGAGYRRSEGTWSLRTSTVMLGSFVAGHAFAVLAFGMFARSVRSGNVTTL